MPYSGASDPSLPKNVKGLPAKQRRRWVAVWNSSYAACQKKGGKDCEAVAFRNANGVALKEHDMSSVVIDGLSVNLSELIAAFKQQGGNSRDKLKHALQRRSKKYGISIQDGGALTIPARFAKMGAREGDFADPVNYRYPVWLTKSPDSITRAQLAQVRNAKARFEQNKNAYNTHSRAVVESRIDQARKKFKVGEFAGMEKANDGVHTGAMIALYPPPEVAQKLALPGGEAINELHVTLAYLGEASDIEDVEQLKLCVARWAKQQLPIKARINGLARFNKVTDEGDQPIVALIDSYYLDGMRQSLVSELEWNAKIEFSREHGFTPHITLIYMPQNSPLPIQSVPDLELEFDTLSLAIAEERFDIKLTGGIVSQNGMEKADLAWQYDIAKVDEERQIVYGVALRPNVADSQGDLITPEEIEQTAHGFLMNSRRGDLLHKERLAKAEFQVVESHIARVAEPPAIAKGDWVVAAKLSDRLWKMVKGGEINGFSIKGKGRRMLIA